MGTILRNLKTKLEVDKTKNAFTLVEILLSIGVLSIVILGLAGALSYSIQTNSQASSRTKATFILDEGIEASRAIRDTGFTNLPTGTYGLDFSSGEWQLSGSSDTIDEFTRTVDISNIDATTKQITVSVEWSGLPLGTNQVSTTIQLTDWLRNVPVGGDWSQPQEVFEEDIPGGNNGFAVQYDPSGWVYLLRQNGNPSFVVFDASNYPNLVYYSDLSGGGNYRDMDQYGTYLYASSQENSSEVRIISTTFKFFPYFVSSIDIPGNDDAYDVDIDGDYLYVGTRRDGNDDEIWIYDISGAPFTNTLVGSAEINANAWTLEVDGDYLYVGTNSGNRDFYIVDISDKSNPQPIAQLNLTSNGNVLALESIGNRVFAGRQNSDLIITIDVSDPLNPVETNSFSINDNVRDIKTNSSNTLMFVGSDNNSNELLVFNISNPDNPQQIGSFNTGGDINDLYYDSNLDALFAASDQNSGEILIFEPN